jgi:glycosyltransferase involved in cell wall biosynthesis
MNKIFVLNVPSFYKINLLNNLVSEVVFSVIFLNSDRIFRRQDFYQSQISFINKNLLKKNMLLRFFELYKIVKIEKHAEVILGGYDRLEFLFLLLFVKRSRLSLIVESYDSKNNVISYLLKFFIYKSVHRVYASGKLHIESLASFKYSGEVRLTGGVGMINYRNRTFVEKNSVKNFVYLGRLENYKGLDILINAFDKRPNLCLHIYGEGPIQIQNTSNIFYHGYLLQSDLRNELSKHDVLILPSLLEPWGLVVEEAIYYGLPVIVSDKVGCKDDLVASNNLGFIFKSGSLSDLIDCIDCICLLNEYKKLRNNVMNYSFDNRDQKQLLSFIN